jgi:hypothetical protein
LALHPLNQQCTAKAKATGQRCERRVVGGTVCHVHGGNAKQVKAKREQRVLLAEAQAEARAAAPATVVMREPEEILLDALHDTNAVLTRIKADLHSGVVNPILLDLCGEWLDRLGRLGKVVVDGGLAERLEKRLGWMAEDRAAVAWAMLAAIVEASPLSAQQKLAVWGSRFDGLQMIADGRAPFRLSGDGVHRFAGVLQVTAAEEEAVAEGDSDFGDDSGVPYLFPVSADRARL